MTGSYCNFIKTDDTDSLLALIQYSNLGRRSSIGIITRHKFKHLRWRDWLTLRIGQTILIATLLNKGSERRLGLLFIRAFTLIRLPLFSSLRWTCSSWCKKLTAADLFWILKSDISNNLKRRIDILKSMTFSSRELTNIVKRFPIKSTNEESKRSMGHTMMVLRFENLAKREERWWLVSFDNVVFSPLHASLSPWTW